MQIKSKVEKELKSHAFKIGSCIMVLGFSYFKKYMCLLVRIFLKLRFKEYDDKVTFVVYPSSERFLYATIYNWPWLIAKGKWKPVLIPRMFIPYEFNDSGQKQLSKNRMGLYFGISASEQEIREATNKELETLVLETRQIVELCGFKECRFSGILEGVLFSRGIRKEKVGAEATVNMIALAVREVKKKENLPEAANIVIIGAGFIGAHLFKEIVKRDFKDNLFLIDVHNQQDFPLIANVLDGEPTIIVDCSGPGVLEKHYLKSFKSGFVLLNEVYFHFNSFFVKRLEELNCVMYHIAGTDGETIPPNIMPYGRYIPGCASWKQVSGIGIKRITAAKEKAA